MTLRTDASGRGRTGDNLRWLAGNRRPCTAGGRPADPLSTCAVHEKAGLTCSFAAIPNIHPTYYDYELSIYRDPRAK